MVTRLLCLSLLFSCALSQAQEPLRICSYNLLWYSGDTKDAARDDNHKIVLDALDPDVLVALEIESATGATKILDDVLGDNWEKCSTPSPMSRTGHDVMLYYRSDLFSLASQKTIRTTLRFIEWYELKRTDDEQLPSIYIAAAHLKASEGSGPAEQRAAEVEKLTEFIREQELTDPHIFFCGDFNFYSSDEPAYQNLINESDFLDPLGPGKWHDDPAFAAFHTQSPRKESFGGGITGGLDDRFDFFFMSPNWDDGSGWEYVDGSCTAFGNDGNHLNKSVNAPPANSAVSETVAEALYKASDHLPLYLDVMYVGSTAESPVVYMATSSGKKYHRPDCKTIQHSTGLIEYHSTAEAVAAGKSPCKVCKP